MLTWNYLNTNTPSALTLWGKWIVSWVGITNAPSKTDWDVRVCINSHYSAREITAAQMIELLNLIPADNQEPYLLAMSPAQNADTITQLIKNENDCALVSTLWNANNDKQASVTNIFEALVHARPRTFPDFINTITHYIKISFPFTYKKDNFFNKAIAVAKINPEKLASQSVPTDAKVMHSLESKGNERNLLNFSHSTLDELSPILSNLFTEKEAIPALQNENEFDEEQRYVIYDSNPEGIVFKNSVLKKALTTTDDLFSDSKNHPQKINYFLKLPANDKVEVMLKNLKHIEGKGAVSVNVAINNFFKFLRDLPTEEEALIEFVSIMIGYYGKHPTARLKQIIGQILNNEIKAAPQLPLTQYYQLMYSVYSGKAFEIKKIEEQKEPGNPIIFPPKMRHKALNELQTRIKEKEHEIETYMQWLRNNSRGDRKIESSVNCCTKFLQVNYAYNTRDGKRDLDALLQQFKELNLSDGFISKDGTKPTDIIQVMQDLLVLHRLKTTFNLEVEEQQRVYGMKMFDESLNQKNTRRARTLIGVDEKAVMLARKITWS